MIHFPFASTIIRMAAAINKGFYLDCLYCPHSAILFKCRMPDETITVGPRAPEGGYAVQTPRGEPIAAGLLHGDTLAIVMEYSNGSRVIIHDGYAENGSYDGRVRFTLRGTQLHRIPVMSRPCPTMRRSLPKRSSPTRSR